MKGKDFDRRTLRAWLSARSIARGLPPPIADHGGYRVDTNGDAEIRRWVFPQMDAGLVELAYSIKEPRHLLKLCGEAEELRSMIPDRWRLHTSSYFMRANRTHIQRKTATGYTIETERCDDVVAVRVRSNTGELAASGYAAETQDAFIYDRIVTSPEHRRKGLGSAVMMALSQAKQSHDTPELLVATEDGRALYVTLGWQTISAYSTASIPDSEGPFSRPASSTNR